MLRDEIARAVQSAPRSRLAELAATIWRAYGAGAISETDAQALAEAVEARKRIPTAPTQPRRVGSRPRAPESLERRRRWVASGWVPPTIACRFTAGELSALSVVASQVAKHGRCDLALDHIAALAGVGRTTVRNALGEARRLGFLTVEVRRLRAFRNDTNVIRIVASAWQSWISMRRSTPGQGVGAKPCAARDTHISNEGRKGRAQPGRHEGWMWGLAEKTGLSSPSPSAARSGTP
jgi:hypothetical protein